MVRIIRDKNQWDKVMSSCGEHDCYHTFEYHQLSKGYGEEPVLLVFEKEDTIIALPLLLRKIEGTKYKDATSVYGYAGPVTNKLYVDEYITNLFAKLLEKYLFDNQIISVFSRLHPFLPQQMQLLKNIGNTELTGRVIYIDLRDSQELQRSKYSKRLKTYVNRARREFRIYEAKYPTEIIEFKKLYYENMDRVNAQKSYYFNTEYFHKLNACKQFNVTYYLIEDLSSQIIIGGGILLQHNDMAQYHLSGTRNGYKHSSPTKLLIDQMRIDAFKVEAKYFNLGGGKGGSSDNLFRFKSLFSPDRKPFYLWKYIVNPSVYEELQKLNSKAKDLNYFPAYRG